MYLNARDAHSNPPGRYNVLVNLGSNDNLILARLLVHLRIGMTKASLIGEQCSSTRRTHTTHAYIFGLITKKTRVTESNSTTLVFEKNGRG